MSVRLVSLRGMPIIPEVSRESEGTKVNQTSLRVADFSPAEHRGGGRKADRKGRHVAIISTLLDRLPRASAPTPWGRMTVGAWHEAWSNGMRRGPMA